MDQSTPMGGALPPGSSTIPSSVSAGLKIDEAARTAHETVDRAAGKAAAQVDRLGRTAHRAVNDAAETATSAAEWAVDIASQAKLSQARLTEATCASIRARPISSVVGALVVGYLLGRLARL